jgi:hypothetical protein
MNQTLPDELDALLGDFFKAQMKSPWPAAPATAPVSTPATASVPADKPYKQPARRDSGTKARVTLAASFALLLGTCWYLSHGFTPGQRSAPGQGGPNILNGSSAGNPDVLKELHKDNAIKGTPGIAPPKVDMIDLP